MSVTAYLDFNIEVTEQGAPNYLIVARSKAGGTRVNVTFPYTDAELEVELQRLENAILYAHTSFRRRLTPREEAVRKLGIRLFEFLLPGEVRSLYYECQRLAESENMGVRISLMIHPPHLAALPWEFLHDPRRRDYIVLDTHTPLVRYPEIAQSIAPLLVTPPLRILGLVANLPSIHALDVEAEQHQVQVALQSLLDRRLVELTWLPGHSWRDLQQWMRPGYGPWHIFHFIGHGEFDPQREEGRIFLADDRGQAHTVSATQLSRLLAPQRSTLRLAILNACEGARSSKFDALSSTAATLVLGGLPAVLAMQYSITDAAAIEFARTFYSALADNLPVDVAVTDARNSINLHNEYSLEWGTPVLFMRTTDGKLFSAQPSHKSPQDKTLEEHSRQNSTEIKTSAANDGMNSEPIHSRSSSEVYPAHTVEQSLGQTALQKFRNYWKESFLPNVRKQHGVRIEAALRQVKDIAIFQDKVILAFGHNDFARAMVDEPEMSDKLVTLLAEFFKHAIKLECQSGEHVQLNILNDINLPTQHVTTPKGQSEAFLADERKELRDIANSSNLNEASLTETQQPLDKVSTQWFIDYWKESFLPNVRKQHGVRIEAALRGVKDVAISKDCVAFAFGSNDFTREIIAEPETTSKIAALLSDILGRRITLECQPGDRAQVIDPLIHYAISVLGARVIKQTAI